MGNLRSFQKGAGRATDDKFGLVQHKKRKRASRRDIPKLQAAFAEIIQQAKKAADGKMVYEAAKTIQAVPAERNDDEQSDSEQDQ